MALMNGSNTAKPVTGAANPVAASKSDDDVAAFKAKKLEALKRFKEKKAAAAQKAYEDALKLRDHLVATKQLDSLPAALKDFVLSLCKDPSEKKVSGGATGGSSIFVTLFGSDAKVGDKITLEQAFMKTYKGKSTLDVWVRRWADKGIVVDIILNKDNMMKTEYVIKALPTA